MTVSRPGPLRPGAFRIRPRSGSSSHPANRCWAVRRDLGSLEWGWAARRDAVAGVSYVP